MKYRTHSLAESIRWIAKRYVRRFLKETTGVLNFSEEVRNAYQGTIIGHLENVIQQIIAYKMCNVRGWYVHDNTIHALKRERYWGDDSRYAVFIEGKLMVTNDKAKHSALVNLLHSYTQSILLEEE